MNESQNIKGCQDCFTTGAKLDSKIYNYHVPAIRTSGLARQIEKAMHFLGLNALSRVSRVCHAKPLILQARRYVTRVQCCLGKTIESGSVVDWFLIHWLVAFPLLLCRNCVLFLCFQFSLRLLKPSSPYVRISSAWIKWRSVYTVMPGKVRAFSSKNLMT